MDRSQVLFPGPRMRAFFRTVLASEPTLDEPTADRLADACAQPIARMWVTHMPDVVDEQPAPSPVSAALADTPGDVNGASDDAGLDVGRLDDGGLEQIAPWPVDALPADPEDLPPAPAAVASEPFDPYGFSVVAVLKREGREALVARLETIHQAVDLKALALAQHLGIPDAIQSPTELRAAIVAGTERRIADRRAAAS